MQNSFTSSPACSLAVRCQGHTSQEAESKWATLLSLSIDHEKTEAWRLAGRGLPVSQKGLESLATLASCSPALCWVPRPLERQVHDTLSATD